MTGIQKTKKLGRYEIHSTLGKGGMATVYKAMDSFLQRTIALKVARVSNLGMATPDKNKLAQCLKEARLAAQFIHPNIVITYDAGMKDDLFYIALEYIDGKGLQACVDNQEPLNRSQVLEIVYNTCYALDYIHKKGYVHLDIKPSNIMLTCRDEVKLMDFGISRILRGHEENNKPSSFHGTPLYMSPEQAGSGETVDQQSDIFSLGIVMYELLTGKKPFIGKSVAELIQRIRRVEPVPISRHLPDVSMDIEQIVLRAMEKKKSDRYETTLDLAEALLPFIKGKDSMQLDKQDKKKLKYLKRLPFFKHFQYSELEEAIRISSWRFNDRQTKITREDENDNTIYFLIQGRASLHIRGKIKVLEPGECFGETAVLYTMPRKAVVIAETNCVVMAINANLLKQASETLQVKFLREFYNKKIMQLVDANLTMIRAGR